MKHDLEMPTQVVAKRSGPDRGRPREFDEDTVLWAAAQAFWDKGYHATSIDDLCKATGLLRGSLYGAYGDKRGILIASLNRYSKVRVARLAKSLESETPSREVLRAALLYYVRMASDLNDVRACFITNTALEMLPQDKEVTELIERILRQMAALWAAAATRAQAAGILDPSLDQKAMGDFLMCIIQGLRILGKVFQEKELTDVVDLALRAIDKR
jgi:TetR/AcrR family transcriptional repressor of nem operon